MTTTANLSFAQLEALWQQAGGAQILAPVMAAVALAESSGNPQSVNPNDNGGTQSSFGLWQISDGTHTPPSPDWATPSVNAQLAVAKEQSQGLSAWGTYDSGAYLKYLPAGSAATPGNTTTLPDPATAGGGQAGAPYTPSPVPGVPSVPPPAPDFTYNPINEAGRIVSWIGEFGAWALFVTLVFLLGVLLLLLGLVLLGVLFLKPAAEGLGPLGDIAGGGILGRMTKGAKGAVSGATTSSGPDLGSSGSHAATGRHAPGASTRVPAKTAVASHNRVMAREDRELRGASVDSAPVRRAHSTRERSESAGRRRANSNRKIDTSAIRSRAG